MMRFLVFFLLLPTVGLAADFTLLKEDQALTPSEIEALVSDTVVEFYEGGQSRYSTGGAYSYTYKSGGTAFGKFEVRPDGAICVLFNNGRDRCDFFVHSHGRVVMITQSGERYPIRP